MIDDIKKLYLKNKEIVNYVIVGGMTTIVSLGSYYICVITFLNPKNAMQLQIANIISWICAVAFAYITNRKYVFESKNVNKVQEVIKFVGARISTLFIDIICMAIFVSLLKINDKLAKLLVQFVVFALNYIFSKLYVFNDGDSLN